MGMAVFCLWAVLLAASVSLGIVTHPNDPNITDIPQGDVIGRWGTASCVVINPNYVLTARHISGDIGTTVTVGQTNYVVAQIAYIGTADLRVTRITTPAGAPANLTDTVALNDNGNETSKNSLAMGGFGKGRGATLYNDSNDAYGYLWTGGNTVLRWGSNKIDGNYAASDTRPSAVIYGYFDAPSVRLYEAIPATYDSGGGWFIKDAGIWKVAGILRAVEHIGESLFNDPNCPTLEGDQPEDYFEAVRVSTYRLQIEDIYDTPKIISGYVINDNNGVEDVLITADNIAGFTKTDSDGYYELWVPSGWIGKITVSKTGYTFSPGSVTYNNVISDVIEDDYIAYIDINNDSFVDWLDVKMLHEQWLNSGETLAGDVTGDGIVNFKDFAKFANGW